MFRSHRWNKGDGELLGFLMNQGSDVTMRNLLRAVRSEKKSGLDYQVDDDFDGVDSTAEGPKIDEQISAAFQQNCLRDVMEHISPEKLSRLGEEKWQNMSPEQLAEGQLFLPIAFFRFLFPNGFIHLPECLCQLFRRHILPLFFSQTGKFFR